jgi:hypothetical protein
MPPRRRTALRVPREALRTIGVVDAAKDAELQAQRLHLGLGALQVGAVEHLHCHGLPAVAAGLRRRGTRPTARASCSTRNKAPRAAPESLARQRRPSPASRDACVLHPASKAPDAHQLTQTWPKPPRPISRARLSSRGSISNDMLGEGAALGPMPSASWPRPRTDVSLLPARCASAVAPVPLGCAAVAAAAAAAASPSGTAVATWGLTEAACALKA